MSVLHLFLIAAIQGATEFLPISSSGHLIVLPLLLSVSDQGQMIDVAVHVGTLGAVVVYFWRDVCALVRGAFALIQRCLTQFAQSAQPTEPSAQQKHDQRIAMALLIATMPIVCVGFVLHATGWAQAMRRIDVVAWSTLVFAVVLYWVDKTIAERKQLASLSVRDAVYLGIAQVCALIPGASRSGVCITAARALGYNRFSATKISMLMSIPTIIASGSLSAIDMVGHWNSDVLRSAALAAGFAFAIALPVLAIMIKYLSLVRFTPYVVYRVLLALVLLGVAYGWPFELPERPIMP